MLAAVYTLAAIIAAIRRPDWVNAVLLLTLGLSVYVGLAADEKALPVLLSLTETTMALTLLFGCIETVNKSEWTATARRAQMIGLLGAGKIILWLAYASNKSAMEWNTVAALINGGLFAQICVAGGMIDDFTARIIDYRRRLWDKLLCRLGYRKVA
jgi:hypothetical protein